jgi:hypothetical protein
LVEYPRDHTFLRTPILNMLQISLHDCLAEASSVFHVGHSSPLIIRDWVERANLLTSWIIHDELQLTRYVGLALLLGNLNFFIGLRDWKITATVLNDFLGSTKEARVSMQVNFAILWHFPFSIEKEVLRAEEAVDLRTPEALERH